MILAAPVAVAEQNPERAFVQSEYRIPYVALIGGLGGNLFQGESVLTITYHPTVSDDSNGEFTAAVSAALFGPGSNVVTDPPTISLISSGCDTTLLSASSDGVAPARSHASGRWTITHQGETCSLIIRAANSGDLAFSRDIPVTFYNDDVTEPYNQIVNAVASMVLLLGTLLLTFMALREDFGVTALMLHVGAVVLSINFAINPGPLEAYRFLVVLIALYNAARLTLVSLEKPQDE